MLISLLYIVSNNAQMIYYNNVVVGGINTNIGTTVAVYVVEIVELIVRILKIDRPKT